MDNDTTQIEIWKPVVGYEGWYEVSNTGNVKRVKHEKATYVGRIRRLYVGSYGYYLIPLYKNGIQRGFPVHRLVALAFLGNPPTDKNHVNHKNAIKTDNRVENLEWVSPKENVNHADALGLRNSFFTSKETQEKILRLLQVRPRMNLSDIAKQCDVGTHIVETAFRNSKRPVSYLWDKGLLVEVDQQTNRYARIQNSDIEEIKRYLDAGVLKQCEIAKYFGVDPAVITRIKKGTYYNRNKLAS